MNQSLCRVQVVTSLVKTVWFAQDTQVFHTKVVMVYILSNEKIKKILVDAPLMIGMSNPSRPNYPKCWGRM
jgi:hypothetical protein